MSDNAMPDNATPDHAKNEQDDLEEAREHELEETERFVEAQDGGDAASAAEAAAGTAGDVPAAAAGSAIPPVADMFRTYLFTPCFAPSRKEVTHSTVTETNARMATTTFSFAFIHSPCPLAADAAMPLCKTAS